MAENYYCYYYYFDYYCYRYCIVVLLLMLASFFNFLKNGDTRREIECCFGFVFIGIGNKNKNKKFLKKLKERIMKII